MKRRKRNVKLALISLIFILWTMVKHSSIEGVQSHPVNKEKQVEEQREVGENEEDRGPPVFLLLSEFNFDNPGNGDNKKQFIEIVKAPNPFLETQPPVDKRNLDGYMLLLVEGNPTRVVLSIDLGKMLPLHKRDYIVIGSSPTLGPDILFSDVSMSYRDGIIPISDNSVYGLILTYIPSLSNRELLTLPKRGNHYEPISLSGDANILQRAIIRESAVDQVVAGRKVPVSACYFFDTVFPPMTFPEGKRYLLRDIQTSAADEEDYTLNRCCEDPLPYDPSCWYIGRETPGRPNDCTGRPFILEKEIERGVIAAVRSYNDLEPMEIDDQTEEPECSASYPNIPAEVYASVNDSAYVSAIQDALSTVECEGRAPYRGSSWLDALEATQQGVRTNLEVPSGTPRFQEFNINDFNACRKYLANPGSLLVPTIMSWLELEKTPDSCRMYCRVCREYLRLGFRPDLKRRSNLLKDKGYSSADPDTNTDAIRTHSKSNFHKEALEYYRKIKAATTAEEIKKVNEEQIALEKKVLAPTINALRLAYLQLQANVAFRSNEIFMNGVSQLGVPLGFKARHPLGLKNFMTILSDEMHEKLLHHLVNFGTYFTLMVDATTVSAITYDIILIQTVEDNSPIIYLWGLIPMSKHDGSKGNVDDLIKRVRSDDKKVPGFEQYFKEKCIALASDSANEMIGAYNSYHVHLKAYLGKVIPSLKCASHALHRVLAHAIEVITKPSTDPNKKPERWFKSFGTQQNQFYSFYLSRGSKRWQRITDLAREVGVVPYRLKKFFDLRWASSEHRCLVALYLDYDLLIEDLQAITQDTSFDKDGREKAGKLVTTLCDKTHAITVAEFLDMLSVLKKMSVRFQEKAGLLVGNLEILKTGYRELSQLRVGPGDNLTQFLEECSCDGICERGTCTLKQYDECPYVTKGGRNYSSTLNHGVKLSDYRDLIYDKMLDGMSQYFDFKVLEAFDLFNNHLFNFECEKVIEAGVLTPPCVDLLNCYTEFEAVIPDMSAESPENKMRRVCTFYGYGSENCATLLEDWKFALSGIVVNEKCKKNKDADASEFWAKLLNEDEAPITPLLNGLIIKMLSTSWTSADAERGFSLVSHLRSPERSSLNSDTLERLVRLKFNGPDVLDETRAYEYARKYVKKYSRTDDKDTKGGNPKAEKEKKFYLKRSRLF